MTTQVSFKARSRILSLLGDQLIGHDYLAIFELVKNAYDADASSATVTIAGLLEMNPLICVQDDGEGMDLDIIATKWLEIGSDHKKKQREAGTRTPKFNRLPLGEKRVGRIACHKLGRRVELVTRRACQSEYKVILNWDELMRSEYLSETRVDIQEQHNPLIFTGNQTGTRIKITELRKTSWPRRDIRSLCRAVTSICSPFEHKGDFIAKLEVPEREEWLEDLPTVDSLMDLAPWHFTFALDAEKFTWEYEFIPPPSLLKRLTGRSANVLKDQLLLPHERGATKVTHDADLLKGIGSISGTFVAYDGEQKILRLYPQVRNLRQFLGNQAGIRVYRDGVRIYNYGEPGDDWLSLDLRRVLKPTERLSRNIVVGGIRLSLAESYDLEEKTNREGFQENDALQRLRKVVLAIVEKFEVERVKDKRRLKKIVDNSKDTFEIPVEKPLSELREKIKKTEYAKELTPLLKQVETDYTEMKNILIRAGMVGINLALIIHEVQRGVQALYDAIRADVDVGILIRNARELVRAFETISGFLRRRGSKQTNIRELVGRVSNQAICGQRFRRHHITVTYRLPEKNNPLVVYGTFDLLLGTLANLVDNALYWLRVRYPDPTGNEQSERRIFIGTSDDFGTRPALIVADNGPGFQADPHDLVQPFVHMKPGGSGLGLYYASIAMQLCAGSLEFPDKKDVDVPAWVDGAIVALLFKEQKK